MSMFVLLYLITCQLDPRGTYLLLPNIIDLECKEPPFLVHAHPYAKPPDGMHTIYIKRGNQLPCTRKYYQR